MEYDFREIEKKWQKRWAERGTYRVKEDPSRPKYYVLDMFPYPSGAGLHVGHPLGYIASDIYTRYKRLKGFNVLHPMGYDAFGLPAEQYAIQTGQHPAVTTERNIARYREQLDKIGFSFDWDREVRTCDPKYYHWTQWAFLKMFGDARPYVTMQSCKNQFYSDLITPLPDKIHVPGTQIHIFYALKMGKKYRARYQRHFAHPVLHEQNLQHEELLACHPEQWAHLVKSIAL